MKVLSVPLCFFSLTGVMHHTLSLVRAHGKAQSHCPLVLLARDRTVATEAWRQVVDRFERMNSVTEVKEKARDRNDG
ncbi:MAG: hypothetical protein KDI16_12310 [Halioglobus sp.]|nr:hypothetical protein [Halioglobus sp.]